MAPERNRMECTSQQRGMIFGGVLSVEEEVWSSVTIQDVRVVGFKLNSIKDDSGLRKN
jgi:hypothetical protein